MESNRLYYDILIALKKVLSDDKEAPMMAGHTYELPVGDTTNPVGYFKVFKLIAGVVPVYLNVYSYGGKYFFNCVNFPTLSWVWTYNKNNHSWSGIMPFGEVGGENYMSVHDIISDVIGPLRLCLPLYADSDKESVSLKEAERIHTKEDEVELKDEPKVEGGRFKGYNFNMPPIEDLL